MLIFVTGGARSGKSGFALDLAEGLRGGKLFLATAEALDEEMRHKIQRHREQRGNRWDTLEKPIHLGEAIRSVSDAYEVILIDCFTVWMSNLLCKYPDQDEKISEVVGAFFSGVDDFNGTMIAVSNEVGAGIVPDNRLSRAYRDELGFLNQRMARRADQVYILFSGIPLKIKG